MGVGGGGPETTAEQWARRVAAWAAVVAFFAVVTAAWLSFAPVHGPGSADCGSPLAPSELALYTDVAGRACQEALDDRDASRLVVLGLGAFFVVLAAILRWTAHRKHADREARALPR